MSRIREWARQNVVVITSGAFVVVTAAALWVPIAEPQPVDAAIQMSFGLDREPLTRTFQTNACSSEDAPDAACQQVGAPTDRDQGGESATTVPTERPAIVTTTLLGDLTPSQCESLGEPADAASVVNGEPAGGGFQFPADQVTVAAELRGSTAISVRVTADPWKPEQVPGGTYCQQVLIERESGPQYFVSLAVSLVDREAPVPLFKATWALVIGALIGVLVRLLNDPLGPMIRLRRRHRALSRAAQQVDDQEVRQTAENLLREAGDAMVDLDVEDSRRILEEVERLLQGGTSDAERQATLLRAQVRLAETAANSQLLARERKLFRLLDRYWLIGIALIVVLVVVTGLQALYVNNQEFDGRSSANWLALIAFGLAAQVTVGSLAEAAGKLTPSGSAGRSGV
jgi:hypothetical protein